MSLKRVKRKLACVVEGRSKKGKVKTTVVDAYVSGKGKFLFVHRTDNGWGISHRHTGLRAIGGVPTRRLAAHMMEHLYGRCKVFRFKNARMGVCDREKLSKREEKVMTLLESVSRMWIASKFVPVMVGGEELFVAYGRPYCTKCGSQVLVCVGKYVDYGHVVQPVEKPRKRRCHSCGSKRLVKL